MIAVTDLPGCATAVLAGAGVAQALFGLAAVWRFHPRTPDDAPVLPPVTVLKPLHGDEPMLEDALASFCTQSYPEFQIVFGVHSAGDPALAVLDRLRERFPRVDMQVVVDSTLHGRNRKVGNLINMLPAAAHDVIVVSDSDIHVEPDYLRHVVATLEQPGAGLVTTLYAGLPSNRSIAAQLGSTQINHAFMPGVVLARWLGRQACLGATMALRRGTLDALGGFEAVVQQVADDAVLGQLVNRIGQDVRIAPTVPATTVPETNAPALLQHELRWARTTRSLAPVGYALSALQYPLFWAMLAMALTGGAMWSVLLFLVVWFARAMASAGIDRVLRLPHAAPIWLLPLRDLLSVIVIVLSYGSDNVYWRGETMSVATPRLASGLATGLATGDAD